VGNATFAERARRITLAGMLVAGFGCGTLETSNDRVNPTVPLWLHRPLGSMDVVFRREIVAASRAAGEPYERGRAEIDAAHGRVFVGTSDHGLYALRADSGSTLWRFETMGTVQCEPLYDADLDVVYFGSNDGALYAVHASDGALVWRYDTGAEVARRAVRDGETLFVGNAADNLFALERRTGRAMWHVHRTPSLGMEVSGYAGPSLDGSSVFFAFSDGHVAAYDSRDGSERWPAVDLSAEAEQSKGTEGLRYLDVDTTPVPDDLGSLGRVIFVASYSGGVFALDEDRGSVLWRSDEATGVTELTMWRELEHSTRMPGLSDVDRPPLVPKRELLLASSGPTGLWALEPATGKTVWRVPIPEGGITAPVPIMGALLVGTTHYGAFLLSPRNGRAIDSFDLGSGFSQTPAAFGDRAYLLTNAGTLVGIEVSRP
jgi:outer membrane protein assembly factor BamB